MTGNMNTTYVLKKCCRSFPTKEFMLTKRTADGLDVQCNIRTSKEILARLKSIAKSEGMSLNLLINLVLEDMVSCKTSKKKKV